MAIYAFEGRTPRIAPSAYIHPEATVIGDVVVEEGCYIGPGARLRGDWGTITIGPGSNIQENCVLHARPDYPLTLARDSHIGHAAVLHGCTLGADCMVGIGAIILDGAVLGEGCIVGAGALITAHVVIPPRKILWGAPAEIRGDVSPERAAVKRRGTARYQALPERYRNGLVRLDG
jgi:carbonic anhydrase/acetyltransferase-like protein (isoleucine patch superfamily)